MNDIASLELISRSIMDASTVTSEVTVWDSVDAASRRPYCLNHEFVNGSLHSLSQDGKRIEFPRDAEDATHVPFCYCKYCKLIQCVHLWDREQTLMFKTEKRKSVEFFRFNYCVLCRRFVLADQWARMENHGDGAIEKVHRFRRIGEQVERSGRISLVRHMEDQ